MHKPTTIASCMITLSYSGHKTWWIHGRGCRQAPSSLENAQLWEPCDLYDCLNLIGSQVSDVFLGEVQANSLEPVRCTDLQELLLVRLPQPNCFNKTLWIHGRGCKQDSLESAAAAAQLKTAFEQGCCSFTEKCAITSSHSLCTNWVEYGNVIINFLGLNLEYFKYSL